MYALVLVLNKVEYLDELLEELMSIGVKGATILDSQGMGTAMAHRSTELPIFGSFKSLMDLEQPYNKTVFTIIESEDLLQQAIASIRKVVGDLSKPGEGLMFTVPVLSVMGMSPDKKTSP